MTADRAEPPPPDPHLSLMFACAHPAIDPGVRAPLMLQVVLGLDARRMASVFLVSPGTLGQRLTRAKAAIDRARVPFVLPRGAAFDTGLADVLTAIYAAYAVGSNGLPAGDRKAASLGEEAIWLASLVAAAVPQAEAHALFALMLFAEARRPARLGPDGALVPLDEQDPRLWDARLLADAERAMANAVRRPSLGRFQLEAAIQAMHGARAHGRSVDWDDMRLLYAGLVRVAPTVGALTGEAAVVGRTKGPAAGLAALDRVAERAAGYQPWWAVRAHLAAEAGATETALFAYDRAIGLADDPAARLFLAGRRARLRHA